MNHTISNIFTVTCVATALLLTTGCGDVPDENDSILIMDVDRAEGEPGEPINLANLEQGHLIHEVNRELSGNEDLMRPEEQLAEVKFEPNVEVIDREMADLEESN